MIGVQQRPIIRVRVGPQSTSTADPAPAFSPPRTKKGGVGSGNDLHVNPPTENSALRAQGLEHLFFSRSPPDRFLSIHIKNLRVPCHR